MDRLERIGVVFFCSAMVSIGVHQLFYGEFNIMLVPRWPLQGAVYTLLAYVGNITLIALGLLMMVEPYAQRASVIMGTVLLALCCFSYIPYELLVEPYNHHLAVWTNALKELAFAGGAFLVAGTAAKKDGVDRLMKIFARIQPYAIYFFCFTMCCFGLDHLLYMERLAKALVPTWIPFPEFWTVFTGCALLASGVSIALNMKRAIVGILLASMIFSWFIVLHIPRAIANPLIDQGNEITSAFSALAFSGTALIIASLPNRQKHLTKVN